jgi:hypothetical protein
MHDMESGASSQLTLYFFAVRHIDFIVPNQQALVQNSNINKIRFIRNLGG